MKKLNIGVIGLGAIGQKHCEALVRVERAEICALADVDEPVLSSSVKKFNGKAYTSYEDLLHHPGLDAVVVATPDELHTGPCLAAANAGKHILVEKPIATTI